jgi:diphosphomevalonate decarboxylase
MEIIHTVRELRESGTPCYFTIDAGPNVKVMCLEKNEKEINNHLLSLEGVQKTIMCKPGDGAKVVNNHLF